MFLFRDGLLTLMKMASLIIWQCFVPLSPHCWICLLLLYDLWCCNGHRGVRGLQVFFKFFCKGSTKFSNVVIFTVCPATLISVYQPTFLKDRILVLGSDYNVPASLAFPEMHLDAMLTANVFAAFQLDLWNKAPLCETSCTCYMMNCSDTSWTTLWVY